MNEENQLDESRRMKESSLLFSPYILGVIVICLLVAIWFKLFTLIGVLAFVLFLALFMYSWNKIALKNIKVGLDIPVFRMFAEDEFVLKANVKNNKRFPLVWLEWVLPSSQLVSWRGETTYMMRLLWMLAFKEVNWEIKGKALRRGVYQIDQITICSGDGFRFSESKNTYDMKREIYIYPKLVPVHVPVFHPAINFEVQGNRGGLLEDPLIVSGVRDYELGDNVKRLNWWASARSGKMQTNVYEPIINRKVMAFVDIRGFFIMTLKYADDEEKQQKYEEQQKVAFEQFLSVIASFIVAYGEQGVQVGYASNGLNHLGNAQSMVLPQKDYANVLDAIAQLTQHGTEKAAAFPAGEPIFNRRNALPIYLFCDEIESVHVAFFMQHRESHDIRFYYRKENERTIELKGAAFPLNDLFYESVVNNE